MIQCPWSSTRRLGSGLRIGGVAALILFASVLLPTLTVFAHELTRSTDSMTRPPTTQSSAALEGLVEIVHEDRADGTGIYRRVLFTDDQKRWSLDGVPGATDLLTGDWVRVQGDELQGEQPDDGLGLRWLVQSQGFQRLRHGLQRQHRQRERRPSPGGQSWR